ncbi:MAG: molybdopterin-binding protein [Acidimicrobiia bacterium]|nr:molybdopterin-binding protein [Acidimicrobiia bacterium]
MVTVRLPSALRRYAGDSESLQVGGSTVAAAIASAATAHPDLAERLTGHDGLIHPHLAVFVGERRVDRHDAESVAVGESDVVTVLIGIAGGGHHDVRMTGFRERATVEDALRAALDGSASLPPEEVLSRTAAGRVTSAAVTSEFDLPSFRRSTMDGYAVVAADTFGASAYAPIGLAVVGASMPGRGEVPGVAPGSAVRIMTGAPLPVGADAVLRAEDAEEADGTVSVKAPVAAGRNVGRIGEDVVAGTEVLPAGRRLLPQDIGLLAAIGRPTVEVHRRPVVRVIVSGDELLAPGEVPQGSRIVDSNSPMLEALVARDGGAVAEVIRLPDGREPMWEALRRPGADVIVTSGAVSVGQEDHTPGLVAELGELRIHGVAMRPSSPTGIGRIGGAPVLLLPGNPVSCLVAYEFFAGPVIRVLGGRDVAWPHPTVRLTLAKRLVSQIGRTDYCRVAIRDGAVEPLAIGGASVLSSVTRADGFVIVPAGSEGFAEGTEVEVGLYRGSG